VNLATAIRNRFNRRKSSLEPARSPTDLLMPLPDLFRVSLLAMYAGEPQVGDDGHKHELDRATRISPAQGMWLYEFCRETRPQATLEIGMAYGFSTVYFLAALHENDAGHHTAIDPFQRRAPGIWAGIGLRNAQRLAAERFRFIEEASFGGLVRLAQEGRQFDVIFIDGNHIFDTVLVDFTLSAEICPVGGHIILDDMWMPSIRRVVAFILTNRCDFEEIQTPIENITQFRRIGPDCREWNHFVDFGSISTPRRVPTRVAPQESDLRA
jgi:predicted O-methyltransferase YrrM